MCRGLNGAIVAVAEVMLVFALAARCVVARARAIASATVREQAPMIAIEFDGESTVVCRPLTELDLDNAMVLRQVISHLRGPGVRVTIDLRNIDVIDDVGMSALVGPLRRVRSGGGATAITNANAHVQWVLASAGVHRLIEPRSTASGSRPAGP
jgi:anti-anti-sigma factor